MIRFVLAVLAALLTAPALAQAPDYGPGPAPCGGTAGNILSAQPSGVCGDSGVALASLFPLSQRAPGSTDDITAGYLSAGMISAVTPTANGTSGCTAASATFSGGGGSGAAATALISGGVVAAWTVTAPGFGYTGNPTVTVSYTGCTAAPTAAAFARTSGSLWVAQGRAWRAAQVSAGQAVWVQTGVNNVLPLDAVSTQPVAAYGAVKLRAAYTGNAIQLTRGSDSTSLAIGFVGNYIDAATADRFCIADANTCYITIAYDQGANGYNATATAGVNAPIWSQSTIETSLGRMRALTFNSTLGGSTQVSEYMALSGSQSVPINQHGVFWVGQNRSTSTGMITAFDTTNYPFDGFTVGGITGYPGMAWSSTYAPYAAAPTGPAFLGWNFYSGEQYYRADNRSAGFAIGYPATAMVGGYIGYPTTARMAVNDTMALLIYNTALTPAQVDAIQASISIETGLVPQARDVLAFDGDSITYGFGPNSDIYGGYARQASTLMPNLPLPRIYNTAVSGNTIAQRVATFATNYQTVYESTAKSYVIFLDIGINDISQGASATTAFASWQGYAAMLKGLGSNVKLVCATLLPVGPSAGYPAGANTISAAFNALLTTTGLTSNGGYCDAIADFRSDPTMGNTSTPTNSLYYNSADQVHPTDLGAAYLAPYAAAAIRSVMHLP